MSHSLLAGLCNGTVLNIKMPRVLRIGPMTQIVRVAMRQAYPQPKKKNVNLTQIQTIMNDGLQMNRSPNKPLLIA